MLEPLISLTRACAYWFIVLSAPQLGGVIDNY